ncbi:kinase-like domain-containing protein [Leptodontidium sp. 2 PMI_412]|nr:kinase-like domain-containing protein [Leptodontidium sp. 2 PMI_412]
MEVGNKEFEELEVGAEDNGDDGELLYGIPSSDNVENVEHYRPKGFHPVRIGDQFNQYKVVHKLGYGGFATVWLARDQMEERYVALKIVMAGAPQDAEDIDIKSLLHIKDCASKGILTPYVDLPLDHFWFDGPNGRHVCVVSRFHGPSIASLISPSKELRLGFEDSRRMALQLTQSLATLHSSKVGIAHGDFTTSNILFELENMDSWSIEKMYEELGEPSREPVYAYNLGPLGPSAPEHLYEKADLTRLLSYRTGNLKIIDFGESFFLNDAPKASDVWALACTIFEMRAGFPLFESFMGQDGDALRSILMRLGSAPSHLEALSCLKENEETRNGIKLRDFVGLIDTVQISLDADKDNTSSQISGLEAELLADLLSGAVRYDVEERSTAAEMLGHAWFSIASPK